MIVGIHDLDYFSRVRSPLSRAAWRIVPRNDGTTRDAWIAAGEISALFGAEVWPSRQALAEAGVRLDRFLPEGHARQEMLDRLTEACGWRGIVRNGPDSVVCDTPAREVAPALLELLEWASRQTQAVLVRPQDRKSVRATIACIAEAVNQFIAARPSARSPTSTRGSFAGSTKASCERRGTESALPPNVTVAGARELLAFNRRTADLPRFQFVAHFLDEGVRRLPRRLRCRRRGIGDGPIGRVRRRRAAVRRLCARPRPRHAARRAAFVAVDFRQPVQWPLAEPVRDVRSSRGSSKTRSAAASRSWARRSSCPRCSRPSS